MPDPGIPTASGARLQHDGGRLARFQLPEGRTIRVLCPVCDFEKKNFLGRLLSQSIGVIFELTQVDTGALFFPDSTQTQHNQTQLHKESSLFIVREMLEMLMVPLVTAGVSDDVAQDNRCRMAHKRWKMWRNRYHP